MPLGVGKFRVALTILSFPGKGRVLLRWSRLSRMQASSVDRLSGLSDFNAVGRLMFGQLPTDVTRWPQPMSLTRRQVVMMDSLLFNT